MRIALLAVIVLFVGLGVNSAWAQTEPLESVEVEMEIDSGQIDSDPGLGLQYSEVVSAPLDTPWLRLNLAGTVLAEGQTPAENAILRITSLADGATQHLTATRLRQWQHTSAYFNGDSVLVELITPAGDEDRERDGDSSQPSDSVNRVVINELTAGITPPEDEGGIATICFGEDDREPSFDPRSARVAPGGCTGWLIDDANHCFLSAGHCVSPGLEVMQFNVPLSNPDGSWVHPPPEDQYVIDPVSIQFLSNGLGDDWCYYGCFPNSETNLTAFEAQGESYTLADSAPESSGQTIRITGFGSDGSPPEWNQIQQTAIGPYIELIGTRVTYQTDTTGGTSGSPVVIEGTGQAIGIHTNGGCNPSGGANSGTAVDNANLQSALNNPLGVCADPPGLLFDYPTGLPNVVSPDGTTTITVAITGQEGSQLQERTVVLNAGGGDEFQQIPMQQLSSGEFEGVFPSFECGATAEYFLSAQTTDGEVVLDPLDGADDSYLVQVADALDVTFFDTFEEDLGWTVTDDGGLTTGTWQRGEPIGGGFRGDPPDDADSSGKCYLTGNLPGDNDIDDGSTTLTSPIMDASNPQARIHYWRWFSNTEGSSPFEDIFIIQVSDDGGANWSTLETVGPAGPEVDGGWFEKQFRVADVVEPTDQFRIRFIASDIGGSSIVEAGVDGVILRNSATGYICGVTGDLNGDGTVDGADLGVLLGVFGSDDASADLNDDGTVDGADLGILLGQWS